MFFFSSRRRHTRSDRDWSSDVCSSDLRTLGSVVIFSDRPAASTWQRRVTVHGNPGPASTKYTFLDILGESPALRKALNLARAAARGSQLNPILIVGERGPGKKLVPHAINADSPRPQ